MVNAKWIAVSFFLFGKVWFGSLFRIKCVYVFLKMNYWFKNILEYRFVFLWKGEGFIVGFIMWILVVEPLFFIQLILFLMLFLSIQLVTSCFILFLLF